MAKCNQHLRIIFTALEVMKLIFAVLHVSFNDGPYSLSNNGSFYIYFSFKSEQLAVRLKAFNPNCTITNRE